MNINTSRQFTVPPHAGYRLAEVNIKSIDKGDPSKGAAYPASVSLVLPIDDENAGKFTFHLDDINFQDNPHINITCEAVWIPTDATMEAVKNANNVKIEEHKLQISKESRSQYINAVKDRIKIASNVRPRMTEDLREEERTIIYRKLIGELTKVGIDNEQSLPVTAELIRSILDIDKLLYYVAPEWWVPHWRDRQRVGAVYLTPDDKTSWDGANGMGFARRDNSLITEDSEPAKMGASLGWLLQLDGDSHRNAFLNSPWVKAVIPIRPEKELEAIEWLKQGHIEGVDGLASRYDEDKVVDDKGKEISDPTIEDALMGLIREANRIYKSEHDKPSQLETLFQDEPKGL